MSGALALSSAPFSDSERADIRRFCGYPPYGRGDFQYAVWRVSIQFELLEAEMTRLTGPELQNVRLKLADLYVLEAAIPAAGAILGTDSAAVWTRNANEVQDRIALMRTWQFVLCGLLGVEPGPQLAAKAAVRMVL